MGRACSTHGRYDKFIQYFGWKARREENSKGIGVDWKIKLE
jgi:hypothetical protein